MCVLQPFRCRSWISACQTIACLLRTACVSQARFAVFGKHGWPWDDERCGIPLECNLRMRRTILSLAVMKRIQKHTCVFSE
jgi:hypothetical protein